MRTLLARPGKISLPIILISLFWLFLIGLCGPLFSLAAQELPRLEGRVTDTIGLLSPADKKRLTEKLAGLDQKTGAEVVVAIVASTKPLPIEDYSIRLAEKWKIGKKGADNGVILLIAKEDRKLRIEVGYGLEGLLSDARSKQVISDTIVPYFKKGDFAGGIEAGVDRLIRIIEGGPKLLEEERKQAERQKAQELQEKAEAEFRDNLESGFAFFLVIWFIAGIGFLVMEKNLWGLLYLPLLYVAVTLILAFFFDTTFYDYLYVLLGYLLIALFVKGASSSSGSSSGGGYSGSSYSGSFSSSSDYSSGSSYSGGGGSFGGGGASGSW